MRNRYLLLAIASAFALSACGEGGSGNAPSAAVPSPAPPPPPPPPPVTATARVYATSLATGVIEFTNGDIDTFGQYWTLGFTARDGRYYPGHANAIAAFTGIGGAPGASPTGDYALSFKRTLVIDHETGVRIAMNAPANVRMVTPVTAMLVAPGSDPTKLKTQLGINSSLFGMVADPDLATYDAIAEAATGDAAKAADAARMHAANLRVLTIISSLVAITNAGGYTMPGIDLSYGDNRPGISPTEAVATRCLAAAPAVFIFQNDRMSSIIQCYLRDIGIPQPAPPAYLQLSATKVSAIARLINGYAAAMAVRLETSTEKARWQLGINGYLQPVVGRVVTDTTDNAAQALLAIGAISPVILSETSRYTEFYRYNDTGLYMPSPDFFVLAGSNSLSFTETAFTANDSVLSNEKFNTRGFDRAGGSVQSVTVPAANASELSITKDGTGTYTISALNSFKGATYFDYVVKASNDE